MTNVRMQRMRNGLILTVDGHADRANDESFNECCAAVSTLCCAALNTFSRMHETGKGYGPHEVNEPGHMELRIYTLEKYMPELNGMADMLQAGFEAIEATYPGRIRVE